MIQQHPRPGAQPASRPSLARAPKPIPSRPPLFHSPSPEPGRGRPSEEARPQRRRGRPSLRARANRESTGHARGPPTKALPRSRSVHSSLSEKPAFSDLALGRSSPWPAALHKRSLCKLGPGYLRGSSPSGLSHPDKDGSLELRSLLPILPAHQPPNRLHPSPPRGTTGTSHVFGGRKRRRKRTGCSRWSHPLGLVQEAGNPERRSHSLDQLGRPRPPEGLA